MPGGSLEGKNSGEDTKGKSVVEMQWICVPILRQENVKLTQDFRSL